MAQETTLKVLQRQAKHMDVNREDMLAACKTQAQRIQVWDAWEIADRNLHIAQNNVLIENSATFDRLRNDLIKAQDTIEQKTANLQNIVSVLNTITAGVRLASSLVALGMPKPVPV